MARHGQLGLWHAHSSHTHVNANRVRYRGKFVWLNRCYLIFRTGGRAQTEEEDASGSEEGALQVSHGSGACKWFNVRMGFGFLSMTTRDGTPLDEPVDVFVHQVGLDVKGLSLRFWDICLQSMVYFKIISLTIWIYLWNDNKSLSSDLFYPTNRIEEAVLLQWNQITLWNLTSKANNSYLMSPWGMERMCLGQAIPNDLSLPFTLDHKGFVK